MKEPLVTRKSLYALLTACAVWLGMAACATAGSYTDFTLMAGRAGFERVYTFDDLAAKSGTVILPDENSATATLMNGSIGTVNWLLTWDSISFNPDPFISFVGGFSNLLAAPTDFTFATASPVAPLISSFIGGSTFVTVADANGDGAGTLKNITGLPGYSGTIDGANALDLLNPFSITVPFALGVAGTSASAGLPGPTIPDGPVVAFIGITQRFNLTGMDNATFNSTFQVVARVIPEPSSIVLAGLGVLGLLCCAWRRRRK
jgi:PEP-CTERM motif